MLQSCKDDVISHTPLYVFVTKTVKGEHLDLDSGSIN